jgi:serine phosphatase RsbU (regulator of sigma subunit)
MGTLRRGIVHQAIQGESLCGDAYCVIEQDTFVLVAVVDGLGHGPEAHEAALKAIATIEKQPDRPVQVLLEACHMALRGTRGAVAAIARIDRVLRVLTYTGLGNIEARIVGADKVRRPVSVNGIVGYEARKYRVEEFPFLDGDMLIMHSDGISDRFAMTPAARFLEPQMLAMQLASAHGRPNDDQLLLLLRDEP